MKGTHILAEFRGCNFEQLDNLSFFENLLIEAALKINATILNKVSHKFEPQGLTIILLLSESHLSAHNAPELGYSSVDIYTCGTIDDPMIALDFIKGQIDATEVVVKVFERSHEIGTEIKERVL